MFSWRRILRFGFATLLTAAALWMSCESARAGFEIHFTEGTELTELQTSNSTLYGQVIGGFNAAAQIWQNLFYDDVTVNIEINYKALEPNILGQAGSNEYYGTYSLIRSAIIGDAQTWEEYDAAQALPDTPSLAIRTNDRSGAVIVDNDGTSNNRYILVTGANAKALNLRDAHATDTDASITFSSLFNFDFDRSDGIQGGLYDFIGVAAHEIGHALGFTSGLDDVDTYTGNGPKALEDLNDTDPGIGTLDDYVVYKALDLFRNTPLAPENGYDWTTGGDPKFTFDPTGEFSNGLYNGTDGRQASHWRDNLGLGLMDPTIAPGEQIAVSALDTKALDVIGWNTRQVSAVPEPGSMALCASAAAGWYALRRRRLPRNNAG